MKLSRRIFIFAVLLLLPAGASLNASCGTATDADGSTYSTVVIGTQCWMKESMRVGTMINSGTTQTNNGTIEKYCYNNQAANCTTNHPNYPDGGFYTWDEAMKYSVTEGAQGICPAGWHIPTDADWHTLENYLKDSGQVCNPNRDETLFGFVGECSSAGLKLKPGGASGFEGNLAGLLSVSAGGSAFRDMNGMFWSSSQVPPAQALGGSPHAWDRMLNFGKNTVYRAQGEIGKFVTIPVRCVQNSNTLPSASIIIPSGSVTVPQGQVVSFSGSGSDTDIGDSITAYEWREGVCGTGTLVSSASSFNKGDFGIGSHVIYFRVKDSQNAWSTNCPSRTITVTTPTPCTLPWGGTIASGNSTPAYQTPSVTAPATCTSQTRTCTNGTLSGTYTNQSCLVNPALAIPTVTTPTATAITTTGATLGATVTSLGNSATISARGTCWGTTINPTTNCTPAAGLTTGVFTHARTGMTPGTIYYYRGYATNATGTGYSPSVSFTTMDPVTACVDTWTARVAAEQNEWQSVTYGNGLFVAVADSGTNRVMTSLDGITWTARSIPEANTWNSVTYGNGLFVAVSRNGTNRVMTSPDGITWTARAAAMANPWASVTYGNGIFVAVACGYNSINCGSQPGANRIMTSPNGINWTLRTAPAAHWWSSVTYGGGITERGYGCS